MRLGKDITFDDRFPPTGFDIAFFLIFDELRVSFRSGADFFDGGKNTGTQFANGSIGIFKFFDNIELFEYQLLFFHLKILHERFGVYFCFGENLS